MMTQSSVVSSQRPSKGALTWYGGLPPWSIDNFDTFVKRLSNQSRKRHLHTILDININCINIQSPRSLSPVTFTDKDFKGINRVNHDDPMVVFIAITNFMVFKVLIDQGISTNILYWKTFQSLKSRLIWSNHTMDHSSTL
ncbi:hypothetical protein JHK87_024659 [Glycine soja]|nr:hypothetical protein JHK87_024659 [Glycine soja]